MVSRDRATAITTSVSMRSCGGASFWGSIDQDGAIFRSKLTWSLGEMMAKMLGFVNRRLAVQGLSTPMQRISRSAHEVSYDGAVLHRLEKKNQGPPQNLRT